MLFLVDFSFPIQDPVLIFSIVLFIILFAPLLLNKIKVPSIMGLIIAGMIVGPHGFNILQRDSSIILFGTVGLLYIMFLAGLELDMNDFKKNKNKSLIFGFLTFIIPMAIGYVVCFYLLEYSTLTSILVASMFATHTLVAYPIISRLGITRNDAVTISVGGTIITDTAVLLVLAIITGSAEGTLKLIFWVRLGISIILFSFLVFYIFPKITRWFFKNVEGENSMQYIFVLAMVFLAGFLAELAGIEPIIGAFMAGLALNRLIPHTSPLMNRIEFVGNTIFIPFFLIGVGMLVDISILFTGTEALIVAGTLLVVAVISKWVAAYFTQKLFNYTVNQRNLLFGLTSARVAATLAVILIGYNLGLIDENVLNGTIFLILVTCLISTFITENAGRKIAIEENEKIPEIPVAQERILVPIANPKTIERLLDLAIMIKDAKSNEAIYPLAVVKDDDEAKEKVFNSVRMLDKAIIHASATDSNVQVITRVDLNIASGIIRAIKELMITEVVLGWSEKLRSTDRIFGTSLDKILHHTDPLTFVYKMEHPLNTVKKIIVLVPKNANLEAGFKQWVEKIKILAKQTGADVFFYSTPDCLANIKKIVSKTKPEINAKFNEFSDWSNYSTIVKETKEDDLYVIVSARRGTVSFQNDMENLPHKLTKSLKGISFIVLYPHQSYQPNQAIDFYQSQEVMYNSFINNTAKQKKESLESKISQEKRFKNKKDA